MLVDIAHTITTFLDDAGIDPTLIRTVYIHTDGAAAEVKLMVTAANEDAERVSSQLLWVIGRHGICTSHVTYHGVNISVQLYKPSAA